MTSAALSGKPRQETFRGRSANSFPEKRLVAEPTIQFEHAKMSSFVKKGHIKRMVYNETKDKSTNHHA